MGFVNEIGKVEKNMKNTEINLGEALEIMRFVLRRRNSPYMTYVDDELYDAIEICTVCTEHYTELLQFIKEESIKKEFNNEE